MATQQNPQKEKKTEACNNEAKVVAGIYLEIKTRLWIIIIFCRFLVTFEISKHVDCVVGFEAQWLISYGFNFITLMDVRIFFACGSRLLILTALPHFSASVHTRILKLRRAIMTLHAGWWWCHLFIYFQYFTIFELRGWNDIVFIVGWEIQMRLGVKNRDSHSLQYNFIYMILCAKNKFLNTLKNTFACILCGIKLYFN